MPAAREGPGRSAGGKENNAATSHQRQKKARGVGHVPVQSRVKAQLEQQRLLSRQREVTRQQRLREAVGGRCALLLQPLSVPTCAGRSHQGEVLGGAAAVGGSVFRRVHSDGLLRTLCSATAEQAGSCRFCLLS